MFFRSFTVIIRAGQGLAPLSRFGLACASTSYGVCVCGATFFWISFSLTAAAISGSLPAGLTLQLRSRFPSNPLFLYLSVSPPSLRLHYNAYALVCQCICVVYLQKKSPHKARYFLALRGFLHFAAASAPISSFSSRSDSFHL